MYKFLSISVFSEEKINLFYFKSSNYAAILQPIFRISPQKVETIKKQYKVQINKMRLWKGVLHFIYEGLQICLSWSWIPFENPIHRLTLLGIRNTKKSRELEPSWKNLRPTWTSTLTRHRIKKTHIKPMSKEDDISRGCCGVHSWILHVQFGYCVLITLCTGSKLLFLYLNSLIKLYAPSLIPIP